MSGSRRTRPVSTTAEKLAELTLRLDEATVIAEKRAQEKQQRKGKLTARQRIDLLLDPGSFWEFDQFVRARGSGDDRPYGDGVVTGIGRVDGRPIAVFSQDFSVFGGSMGEAFGGKVLKVMDHAIKTGCPVVGINDSGGARIQEGVVALAHYAELALRNVRASGLVPQLSLIMGPCAGGAAYSPALTDFTVMVDGISRMFVTGPDVVSAISGEESHDLGSPASNCEISGTAHYLAADEADAVDWARTLLAFLPGNNLSPPPEYADPSESTVTSADELLDSLVPDSPNQTYDMADVVRSVVDEGEILEIQGGFACNMVCAFARIRGRSVGVVANQPRHLAGAIDIDAAEKAARFVRFCDAFGIPILTLVDVPGYLPGLEQERRGIVRRGAKLLYAYAEATVPKVTVVVRKAYGGGYAVMGSRHLGADVNLAWPTAEIAVMGRDAAERVLGRGGLSTPDPYVAAERGYLDRVIRPSRTRLEVATAFDALREKREDTPAKKHGNIPL